MNHNNMKYNNLNTIGHTFLINVPGKL